jgi:hypothetical protein
VVLALAQLADRPSQIETFEFDLVIKFSGHFALFQQNQPGPFRYQAQPNGVARQTTRQVEDQADKASYNRDVQGRRILGNVDIDSLGSHLSQTTAIFGFLASAEPAT